MTSISAVSQKEQPTLTTSEQKQSASIFNNPRATESTPQTVEDNNNTVLATDTVEDALNKFVKQVLKSFASSNIQEKDIFELFAELGYSKEKLLEFTKEQLYEVEDYFLNIVEYVYETSGDKDEKKVIIANLVNYTKGNKEDILDYINKFGNANYRLMLKEIAKEKDLEIPDSIREKFSNIGNIADLSDEELSSVIMILIKNKEVFSKNKKINVEELLEHILFSIPEAKFTNNALLRETIITVIESENIGNKTVLLALIDKSKNSEEAMNSICSSQIFDNLFATLADPNQVETFFIQAQKVIDNGTQNEKSILADNIARYLSKRLDDNTELDQKLKSLYQAATGYAYVRAQKPIAASLHNAAEKQGKDFNNKAYQYAYDYSLKDKNVNPVDVTTKIDEISNNQYSQVLQELGYELPTNENLDELRAQAENGVFEKRIQSSYADDNSSNSIGYTQQSTTIIDNASANADALFSSIVNNTDEQTGFTVENVNKTSENVQEQATLFNKTNLSNYSGSELSGLISNGFMNFSDAVKQYTTHLSESGKRFVVQSIKVMDSGRQTFALNSTSNTARWEIMKKADLLDEDLNVDFDFNHEKLREKYQA